MSSVVLGEAPHAHQAVEGPAALVAVNGAQLRRPSERQVAIAPDAVLEHQAVEGAVHRLDLVHLVLDVHLVEHPLPVEVVVAGGLPQVEIGNVWGVN